MPSQDVRVNRYEIFGFEPTAAALFFSSLRKALSVMSQSQMRIGPRWPKLGRLVEWLARPIYSRRYRRFQVFGSDAPETETLRQRLTDKLARGETLCLVGLGLVTHNSGTSLVEVSPERGICILSNDEEERFAAVKHCADYPKHSLLALERRLRETGRTPADVDAWLLTWDYPKLTPLAVRSVVEEFPQSLKLLNSEVLPEFRFDNLAQRVREGVQQLRQQFDLHPEMPVFSLPHHDNHAAGSYVMSPFGQSPEPVMIVVLDGFGDEGAISLYEARDGQLRVLRKNYSLNDSLGAYYSMLSSAKGGWSPLSSEGRFMGAAAWGNGDRLTNPFYKQLRQIFHLGSEGTVSINRLMANWQNAGHAAPFGKDLIDVIGEPIPMERLWNPDAVLCVDQVQHCAVTRERVDIAAAVQLVFEDAVFHIVDYLIRTTGSDRLIMTGGSALNCLCNMRLMERYNADWYARSLGKATQLQLWTPPIPGDAGVTIGAACHLGLQVGGRPKESLRHPFQCGFAPLTSEIDAALESADDIGWESLGNINQPAQREEIADLLAFILSQNGVIGLFQGAAETGPRALGHRSILANPCNPLTRENINLSVKAREAIRPLAPMVTRQAAEQFFELSPGAAANDYCAYDYMVLTVNARPEAFACIPAVIHEDGTARIQIVRPEIDPFCHAFLQAMGRRVGAEVSVNTSLNVGTPIVQTPVQALDFLRRAKASTGLFFIGSDGETRMAWHEIDRAPKDAGRQLKQLLAMWRGAKIVC